MLESSTTLFDCMLIKEGIESLSPKEVDEMPVETLAFFLGFMQEQEARKWDVKGVKVPASLRGMRGR